MRARACVIALAKGRLEFTGVSVHVCTYDDARPEYDKIDLTKFFLSPRVPRTARDRVTEGVVVGAVVAMKTCLALPHPLLYALTPT